MVRGAGERVNDRITVVVATMNRRAELLASLPRHEAPVILVDNGSTDGTPQAVREQLPHVQIVELGRNLGAPARTVGVRRARTPYVAFADDDSWWAPGCLERAADLLDASAQLALVTARILIGPDERPDPVSAQMAEDLLGPRPELPGPAVLGFLACAAAVRRDAYLASGGFDDVLFFFGEEQKLALDLASSGWELAYVPELVVHHHPSPARDPLARRRLALRNDLLTTLMRRPWPVVAGRLARAVRAEPAVRRGLLDAVSRAPRALARRRCVPADLERQVRLLEG
jgi:GT2 family glycosyltransferase